MDINEKIEKEEAKRILKENGNRLIEDSSDSFVSLRHINKIYPNGVQAVYDFNLEINPHDFIALVGPSGCGKSTTLRMIAGLEEISSGELFINHIYTNYLPSKDRDIAMVFQSYALYPQLNVYDNIAFGLKMRHVDKKTIEERVYQAADILDLGPYLDRKPKELSGGQMQRVALGRAIVRNAKLFLMDEPLSNLDAKLRVQMRSEIVRIHEEVKATTIYVTHDQTEAMTMANKIVVMNKGFIQQIGSPIEIYNHPKNRFVATFIGTPPMNIIKAKYKGGVITFLDGSTLILPQEKKEKYTHFLLERISSLKQLSAKKDELSLSELKLAYLPFVAYHDKYKKEVKKEKKWYEKIKDLFVKKADEEQQIKEAIYQDIEKLLDEYNKKLVEEHEVYFGIRPEDIEFTQEGKKLNSNIVEILGSEFIVYCEGEIGKLTIKTNKSVLPHQEIHVSFNEDKYHLFDTISEENVLL